MKNHLLKIGMVFLATGVIATSSYAETGKVTVNNLRIRETPSTSAEIVEMAADGDKIEVVSSEGDWYKVVYNRKQGYASKNYIQVAGQVDTSSTESTTSTTEEPQTTEEQTTSSQEETSSSQETSEVQTQEQEESNQETTQDTTTQESSTSSSTTSTPVSNVKRDSIKGKTVKVKSNSYLYLLPTVASSKISSINEGTEIKAIYDMKNWVKVTVNNRTGWIPSYNLDITNATDSDTQTAEQTDQKEETTDTPQTEQATEQKQSEQAYINVTTANVRSSADSGAEIVSTLDEFDVVTVVGENGDFYQIESSKANGFVAKRLVTIGTYSSRSLMSRLSNEQPVQEEQTQAEEQQEESAVANNSSNSSNSGSGSDVVAFAKQYLGYDYVSGGKKPSTGFDCSGFTSYVYSNFGYSIGGSSGSQASAGKEVSKSEMQPGDLIIYNNSSNTSVGHVGIYIGNGEFIHAANSTRGVVIDDVDSSYYGARFVSSRHIVD